MGKQRLNRLRGKKVVLTTDANLISPNEVGILEIDNGKVQVKTHVNGVLEDIAGGSGNSELIGYVITYATIDYLGDSTYYGAFIYNISTEESFVSHPVDEPTDSVIYVDITKTINEDGSITLVIQDNNYSGHTYAIIPLGDWKIDDDTLNGGPLVRSIPGRGGKYTVKLIKK